jgi:hypothetical protein
MLKVEAVPQSCIPYVQIGLSINEIQSLNDCKYYFFQIFWVQLTKTGTAKTANDSATKYPPSTQKEDEFDGISSYLASNLSVNKKPKYALD